jgi:hypothetical protein
MNAAESPKTGSVTYMAHMHASHPQNVQKPANADAIAQYYTNVQYQGLGSMLQSAFEN